METLTLGVSGMACGGCANTVKQVLLGVDGVSSAEVTHVEGSATVSYDPQTVTPQQICAAVSAAGYPATIS